LYCDCYDCSDEWKTPVNPNGFFLCENKGYISKEIPKMRLRDGECDCCDGSDELEG